MDDARFRELYPTTPNHVLASMFGMTEAAVKLYASRRGIKKDAAYVSIIQRQRMEGRLRTVQTRAKLRDKALARPPISEATRQRLRQRPVTNRGPNHYKWKGGKPWERFKDPRYQAWREAVLERDQYVCQQCYRQCSRHEKGLAAHHIKPYAEYPDLRYDVSNGLTLCRKCHMALHGKRIDIETIPCVCGCGMLIRSKDIYGRPRRFANHHGRRRSPNELPEV